MRHTLFLTVCAAALLWAPAAFPQGMVEYSLGVAAGAAGSAGMAGTGRAAGSVLANAAKVLDKAGAAKSETSTTIVTVISSPEDAKAVKFTAPEAGRIQPGMEAKELIRRFGEPAMKIGGGTGDTWTYGTDPNTVTVKLVEGKVTSVSAAADAPRRNESSPPASGSTAVVVLR
jgi:hypothetical protein